MADCNRRTGIESPPAAAIDCFLGRLIKCALRSTDWTGRCVLPPFLLPRVHLPDRKARITPISAPSGPSGGPEGAFYPHFCSHGSIRWTGGRVLHPFLLLRVHLPDRKAHFTPISAPSGPSAGPEGAFCPHFCSLRSICRTGRRVLPLFLLPRIHPPDRKAHFAPISAPTGPSGGPEGAFYTHFCSFGSICRTGRRILPPFLLPRVHPPDRKAHFAPISAPTGTSPGPEGASRRTPLLKLYLVASQHVHRSNPSRAQSDSHSMKTDSATVASVPTIALHSSPPPKASRTKTGKDPAAMPG